MTRLNLIYLHNNIAAIYISMSISPSLETYAQLIGQKSPGNIELELRFAIPSTDEYISLINGIYSKKSSATLSRNINFLKFMNNKATAGIKNDKTLIATVQYKNTIVAGQQVVTKVGDPQFSAKQQMQVSLINDDFAPYKLVVSREEKSVKFDIDSYAMIRIKTRISIFVVKLPNWRFDFTLVASPNSASDIPTKREIFFLNSMTVDNFLDTAPFIDADKLEFEVEFIPSEKKTDVTSADIYAVIDFIRDAGRINYTSNVKYQAMIYEVAQLLYGEAKASNFKRKQGLKAFGPSVKGLDRDMYFSQVMPNITDFLITEKADGENIIGYIKGNILYTIGPTLGEITLDRNYDKPTVYQAEMHNNIQYIHDVMIYNGDEIFKQQTTARISMITHVVKMLPAESGKEKKHIPLTNDYATEMKKIYSGEYPYKLDGLIFTKKDKGYLDAEIYKWKPPNQLTIDFYVGEPPATGVVGIAPHVFKSGYKLLFLFCGITDDQMRRTYRIRRVAGYGSIFSGRKFYDYMPIQFSPVSDPISYLYYHPNDDKRNPVGHIGEFAYEKGIWVLRRIRTDRDIEVARGSDFGNNIAVAESIWNNIKNPLTFDMLRSSFLDASDNTSAYFNKTDARYKSANAFSSFVKNQSLIGQENQEWVIDLAAGRGADLGRWSRLGIKNALCVDNDIKALHELRRRQATAQRGVGHYKTVLYTHHADLNDNWRDLAAAFKSKFPLPVEGVKFIICNLAIHYFCETDVSISNFVMLVDSLIAINGTFIFTCYNGRRVFNILEGRKKYEMYDNGALKYSIIRAYHGPEFKSYGQKIHTLLGFTGGAHYTEYLVDIDYIVKMFVARGFKCVEQKSFGELLEDYSIDNLEKYDTLSSADVEHVSLFDYVIIKKIQSVEQKVEGAYDDENSFIVPTNISKPVLISPSKVKASINVVNIGLDKKGAEQKVVMIGTKALKNLVVGDRVFVNKSFNAVVHEIYNFPTYKSVFDAYTPADFGYDMSSADDMITAFRKKYVVSREMRNGVFVIKLARL